MWVPVFAAKTALPYPGVVARRQPEAVPGTSFESCTFGDGGPLPIAQVCPALPTDHIKICGKLGVLLKPPLNFFCLLVFFYFCDKALLLSVKHLETILKFVKGAIQIN